MQPGTRLLFMHRSFLFNSLTLTQRHSNNRYIPSVPLTLRDTDSNSGSPEEKATLHPACFYNLLDPDINKRKNRYFNSIYLFNLTVQVLTPLNQHPIIILTAWLGKTGVCTYIHLQQTFNNTNVLIPIIYQRHSAYSRLLLSWN